MVPGRFANSLDKEIFIAYFPIKTCQLTEVKLRNIVATCGTGTHECIILILRYYLGINIHLPW